jgi:hypothetical protein
VPQGQQINMDSKAEQEVKRQDAGKTERRRKKNAKHKIAFFVSVKFAS